jgi:hypothetical protein
LLRVLELQQLTMRRNRLEPQAEQASETARAGFLTRSSKRLPHSSQANS